jgi:hypothetical protein
MAAVLDWEAREAAIEREYQLLSKVYPQAGVKYKVERIFVRAARVGLGVVFLAVSLVSCQNIPAVRDTPFAQLTLGMIFGAAFMLGLTLLTLYWAFVAAFGSGPTAEEWERKLRREATDNVDRRARANGMRY